MSVTITAAERMTYQDGFFNNVEDMNTGLWSIFPSTDVEGEMKRVDFIDIIDGVKSANSRFTPISGVDPLHTNRWLATQVNYQAVHVDPKDVKNIIMDPKSNYMMKLANAFTRKREDIIIEAFDATVTTGEKGATTQAFDTGNQQIAANGTNLTLDKLNEALYILESRAYADQSSEQLYFVYSPKQKQALLKIAEVVSSDFSVHKSLVDGKVTSFMGFTFIMSNRLIAGDGLGAGVSTNRECYAFTGDALLTGQGLSRIADIDIRKDMVKFPWQLYVQEDVGAVRMQEELVVQVICNETA